MLFSKDYFLSITVVLFHSCWQNNNFGSYKLKYKHASGFVMNDLSIVIQSTGGSTVEETGKLIGISRFQFVHSYFLSGFCYIILFMLSKLI